MNPMEKISMELWVIFLRYKVVKVNVISTILFIVSANYEILEELCVMLHTLWALNLMNMQSEQSASNADLWVWLNISLSHKILFLFILYSTSGQEDMLTS